jgi:hypothetical protein
MSSKPPAVAILLKPAHLNGAVKFARFVGLVIFGPVAILTAQLWGGGKCTAKTVAFNSYRDSFCDSNASISGETQGLNAL